MAGKEAIAQRQLAGNGSSPKFGLTITRKVNFDHFRWKFEPKISVVRLDSGGSRLCWENLCLPVRAGTSSLGCARKLKVMASVSNSLSFKHGLSLWCPQSPSLHRIRHSSAKNFQRRGFVVAYSSFANENREFVIVGGGNAAGYAARTFVEHGMADGRLCIVSKEAYAPYERPALTKGYLFPLDKKPARLPGFHTCVGSGGERQTPEWYKEKGIEMIYQDPVTSIDIEKQTLITNSGKLLKYGSLIVATGCTASRFPEKIGGYLPGVHYIRDVADADALISSLEKAKKVVVVGGGYIGMEVAAAAVGWKLDTTGASIKNLEAGSDGRVAAVKLEDGSTIDADTIVIGIGAKPTVSPFERVGLNSSVGGIQVDGQFRTSMPGIFAIGDVAAFPLKHEWNMLIMLVNRHSIALKHYLVHKLTLGETIEIGNFDPKIATFWIDSGKLKGVLVESGSPEEFQLLPTLARSQPFVDKAKLQQASSVEEALEIARAALPVEAAV
ncbi:Monodehydroascorbate reductase [Citrus sinensis]|uniref:Monodehydroascorbate reductase n=1 Tax=Citrus sinensis TaxID=2711 RepID=A0ACB8LPM7_CITSI|nr:Monodehydroascorbate reductase [Citrus sinensis]